MTRFDTFAAARPVARFVAVADEATTEHTGFDPRD
jgi:hypothetical protein